jgi:hypothetical protein
LAPALKRNPFHYGSPATEPYFTDRDPELATLRASMLNGQNVILISPRRYGKTSLLNRAVFQVREAGGASGRVNLIRCSSRRDVAEALATGIVNGPMGRLRGRGEELRHRLATIRAMPEISFIPTGEVTVRLSASTEEPGWKDIVSDVIRMLSGLARPSRPVSLVMDEFQKVREIDPDLPSVFKDLADELPEVSLIFAGSKRHLMEEMSRSSRSAPLYGVGLKLYLPRIPRPDFVAYLVTRSATAGKVLPEELAATIYDFANGIPNDVQLLAFWTFEHAGCSVDDAAMAEGLVTAVGSQAVEYQATFDRLAPSQQRLLKLIAGGDGHNLISSRVLRHLEVSSTTAVRKARDTLADLELIERDARTWTVTSGLFREWLQGGYEID